MGIHGRKFDRTRFTGSRFVRPNDNFLRWHYQQAVLLHYRGYPAGPVHA